MLFFLFDALRAKDVGIEPAHLTHSELAAAPITFLHPFSTYARALCENSRHFLSEPSITGHCLCEDFPNYLFGSSTAAVSSEKGFYMRMFDGQIRVENNLFLWHFEAKIQKSASEHRYIDEGKFSNINQLAKAVGLDSSFVAANLRLRWLAPKVVHELIQGGIGNVSLKQLRHGVPVLWREQEEMWRVG
ncbi:MAG: hypothetical protein IKC53_08170 [Lentisphaeria bacterium]|nr:hypothetical protein [Lentisphaeria bacterium]